MSRHNVEILPAVFTPMHTDGTLHLEKIEEFYHRCTASGFRGIFLNGTTGECMSLTADERNKILETWIACIKKNNNPDFRIFVHVGSANLLEAARMAEHAQAHGADGIAMVPTFYFRPKNLEELIDQCRYVASAAPEVPFYYYNIPSLTGVNFPLVSFMKAAIGAIPTFAGLKNSFNDLVDYQACIHHAKSDYALYWGTDEVFMMVYAAGNRHYVGSTYNFMGGIYHSMIDAYHAGKIDKLQSLQAEAVRIYNILAEYNSLVAGKEIMKLTGLDCGPVRKPLSKLMSSESKTLLEKLKRTSLFEYAPKEKPIGI